MGLTSKTEVLAGEGGKQTSECNKYQTKHPLAMPASLCLHGCLCKIAVYAWTLTGPTLIAEETPPSVGAKTHCFKPRLGNTGGAACTWVSLTGGELAQLTRVERRTCAEPALRIAAHKEPKNSEIISTPKKCTRTASLPSVEFA